MNEYVKNAALERLKNDRPSERTVENVLSGARRVLAGAGIDETETLDALTREKADAYFMWASKKGFASISARTYIAQLKGLVARWCLPYYRSMGWEIPTWDIPYFRGRSLRYSRPDHDLLLKVKTWYEGLSGKKWFAATMMLEFAMRNGDIKRLQWQNFISRPAPNHEASSDVPVDIHYLSYTPHKTENSSGRMVVWPIHPLIWEKFSLLPKSILPIRHGEFVCMNHELRELGFTGAKASYELRKICIDHVYQKYGAEMASSISGDDIRTVIRYYADPAQPNIGAVRIIDLL